MSTDPPLIPLRQPTGRRVAVAIGVAAFTAACWAGTAYAVSNLL